MRDSPACWTKKEEEERRAEIEWPDKDQSRMSSTEEIVAHDAER